MTSPHRIFHFSVFEINEIPQFSLVSVLLSMCFLTLDFNEVKIINCRFDL